jgi:hypothetical protein
MSNKNIYYMYSPNNVFESIQEIQSPYNTILIFLNILIVPGGYSFNLCLISHKQPVQGNLNPLDE